MLIKLCLSEGMSYLRSSPGRSDFDVGRLARAWLESLRGAGGAPAVDRRHHRP